MGLLFDTHNKLGSHHQEKVYQKAVEEVLRFEKILFERERMVPVLLNNKIVGKYYLDFVIENKIVLEIKTIAFFQKREWLQLRSYLQAANLHLGILVNFNSDKLLYKRIVA